MDENPLIARTAELRGREKLVPLTEPANIVVLGRTIVQLEAGKITRSAVCMRVAPMAYEPSRMCVGTACMASSLSELTYGTIISPITSPALSMLNAGSPGMSF